MKVKFKYGIRTYSGTVDEMTYGSYRKGKVCIGRRYVVPKGTTQNVNFGEGGSNVAKIWSSASADYKADFKRYAELYGRYVVKGDKLPPTSYGLFIKAASNWAKNEDPPVELSVVQLEDVSTLGSPINTVADCVEAGFLPSVPGCAELNKSF